MDAGQGCLGVVGDIPVCFPCFLLFSHIVVAIKMHITVLSRSISVSTERYCMGSLSVTSCTGLGQAATPVSADFEVIIAVLHRES